MTDILSSSVSLIVGSVSGSYVQGGTTYPLTVLTGNNAGDTTVSLISGSGVALYRYTGSLTVTYRVQIIATDAAALSIVTTANLMWYSTPDLINPRKYSTTASTTITVKSPVLTSWVYTTSSILPITSGTFSFLFRFPFL